MADKNNESKNVTAKELLSRLSRGTAPKTDEKSTPKHYNAAEFIESRMNSRGKNTQEAEHTDAAQTVNAADVDTVPFSDEEFAALMNDAEEYASDDAAEYAEELEEVVADDTVYPDSFEGEEYIPDEVYDEYVPDGNAIDPAMYQGEDYSEIAGEYGEEYSPDGADDTYADVDMYGDIMPEDDFFDNDPIGDEEYYDETAYPEEEPEEYDEEKDFENLVAEVAADTGSSDELDETDINLMVALGMEDELAKSMGAETAAQITDDYMADQEEWIDRTKRFGAGEYSDPSENGEIADKYRKRNRWAFWRMIASVIFALALLVFENLPVIGYQLSGALDPAVYPVVYIMVDLQLLFFAAAAAYAQLGKGLCDLVKLKPSVYSVPALALIAAVISSVYTAYTCVPGTEPVLYNFPVALSLLFAAVSEYLSVRREIFSFNIVSSKKPKYVMRRLSTRDSVMENEAVADLDTAAFDENDVIKIQKTDFVDGYFWRTKNSSNANRSYVGLSIIISIAFAAIIGIYAAVAGDSDSVSAVSAAFATLSAALPASMVIVGCYPFYRANRQAYENDATIIGESSVREYSGIGVISFDDVNVFPSHSVKVRNVRLYNNCRIDKVLYYAASVFSATGGPLSDVFEVATMETGHSDNVEILETGSGYIEALVNDKSVMFGSAEALSGLGIIIPEDVAVENDNIPMDCSVMYMIYQRKLVAKMIVNYVIDPDFEYILKQLTASGMCVCVKTFDPNIDENMMYRHLTSSKYSLRVIKYRNTEEITKYARRAEGGIVSRNSAKSLLNAVSGCDKILSAQKTGFAIGVISAILSAAVIAVALFAGSLGSVYSIYIALCQLFWLLPTVITTRLIVR